MTDEHTAYDKAHRKLKRQVRNKHEEVKRLRTIVDRLPKTADGVPVLMDDQVWNPELAMYGTVDYDDGLWWAAFNPDRRGQDWVECDVGSCYSTELAAYCAEKTPPHLRCSSCDAVCRVDQLYDHWNNDMLCEMCHEIECGERNLEEDEE